MSGGSDDPLSERAREIAQIELGRLVDATPVSHALFERATKSMPLGVGSSFQVGDPYPIYLRDGHGSKVHDVDGHEYVDTHGGFGSMVVGHAHPKIREAIVRAIESGSHFAVPTEDSVLFAEELCRRFGLEQVRFALAARRAVLMERGGSAQAAAA